MSTENEEINVIVEELFGYKYEYYVLYYASGEEALARIRDITRRGDKAVLESILEMNTLRPEKPVTSKPWSLMDKTYSLGNFTLAWSATHGGFVTVVETIAKNDPYAVDPLTQIG